MKTSPAAKQSIRVKVDARGIATLTLNRPERHNAFDPDMSVEISAALMSLDASDDVRAIVLTGEGPSFCSGGDIEHMRRTVNFTRAQNYRASLQVTRMFYVLRNMSKPTVAKVRGAVRGGGVGLVAACDIAISANDATFRLSEVRVGMVPAMIAPFVVAAVGERHASRYFLSAEEFGAEDALRIGLVHQVTASSDLDKVVATMVANVLQGGPRALVAAKQEIRRAVSLGIRPEGVTAAARTIARTRVAAEAQEGLHAFLDKRKPAWTLAKPDNELARIVKLRESS